MIGGNEYEKYGWNKNNYDCCTGSHDPRRHRRRRESGIGNNYPRSKKLPETGEKYKYYECIIEMEGNYEKI